MNAENRNPFDFLFKIEFPAYYKILMEQKGFVIVFCLAATLSSLALTYLFSEKYVAGITIYYRPIATSLMRQKDSEAFGAPAPAPPFKVIVQTLRDVIGSDAILRPVVEKLHLDKKVEGDDNAVWYKHWLHSAKDFTKEYVLKFWMILKYGRIIEEDATVAAIKNLKNTVKIFATSESYVYILTSKDKSPERAAKIIDTVGNLLVMWLNEQELMPAQQKLFRIKEQITKKENLLMQLREEREKLMKNRKLISVTIETDSGVKSLYDMEKEYAHLSSEIEMKRIKIAGFAKEMMRKTKNYTNPDDLKRMVSEKLFEEIELKGLLAKSESLESSIKDLKKRLQNMLFTKNNIENLNMKINADMQEYSNLKDLYLETFSQTTSTDSEVKVMHYATIPSLPVQPIKIYCLGLTAILSLFLSTGLVYILAFFNIRVFFASRGQKSRSSSVET